MPNFTNNSGAALPVSTTPHSKLEVTTRNMSGELVSTATNITGPMHKIFLQTAAAQGIAGFFTFAALLITCYQVHMLL